MKALVCEAFGPISDLVVKDLPDPVAAPGHVVVDVKAGGLNFPDILCVQGLYQFKPPTPFVPGQEGAGVVASVGEGVDEALTGTRVAFMGLTGAFAQKAMVPANSLIPLPDAMDFETGAGFTMIYGTSYYALKQRANLQPGETLLVLGAAGGVGLAAVELGKAMGARVIAAASTPEKLETAKAHGADEGILYTHEDLKARCKELTGGKGLDVVYDPVGGSFSEPALRSLGYNGRHLVVGFAAGDIPKIPLNLTLLKSSQIVGVFWGAWVLSNLKEHARNMGELFALFSEGRIRPLVSATYPLEQFEAAFAEISKRRARGKVILKTG